MIDTSGFSIKSRSSTRSANWGSRFFKLEIPFAVTSGGREVSTNLLNFNRQIYFLS